MTKFIQKINNLTTALLYMYIEYFNCLSANYTMLTHNLSSQVPQDGKEKIIQYCSIKRTSNEVLLKSNYIIKAQELQLLIHNSPETVNLWL
jgi:hypothetical protein